MGTQVVAEIRACLVAAATVFSCAVTEGRDWWKDAWPYRQHIEIDGRTIDRDLADFPLRVRFTDAQFARTLAASDGRDLRAVGANGETLALQLVTWNANEVCFYVRVPRIKAGRAGQGFALYFGNSNSPTAVSGEVWNKAHSTVLHLAGDVADASGRKSILTRTGFVIQNGWTPGLVMEQSHPWLTFDRTHKGFVEIALPSAGSRLTLAARFRAAPEGKLTLFSGTAFEVFLDGSRLVMKQGESELVLDQVTRDHWHSVVVAYDARTGKRTLRLDENLAANDRLTSPLPKPSTIRVGRSWADTAETQFGGDVEEVRVMSDTFSPAWLKAVALNLSDANPLVTAGPLERADGRPAAPPPPQLVGPVNGSESHKPAGMILSWLPALGATHYEVLVFADARGEKLLARLPAGTALSLPLTAAQATASDVHWTVAAQSPSGESRARELRELSFRRDVASAGEVIPTQKTAPLLQRADGLEIKLEGYLGGRVNRLGQYLLDFNERNPGLLRMLRERPEKNVPPWAGVFPGQYLSSAQLIWRLTREPKLKAHIDEYVRDLIATQRADGFLDPFEGLNDYLALWNHYAVLTGLLDYYEDTSDAAALAAARRIGDLVIRIYTPGALTLPKNGGANEAISHAIVRLCRVTGDVRYRNFADYVIHEAWNEPGGVAYHQLGQQRAPVTAFPVRRWEGVHNAMTLSEMYWLTGNTEYREDFTHLWQTLRQTERHNTGGFSTNEGLLGTPYNHGTIETCCTVAWTLLSTDMLRLDGDSRVADELEWSTLNSALGSIPYDGTTSTYATQPDGLRQFNVLHQGPPDGKELSCCSTNAGRAIGNLANWALMQCTDGFALNFYGASNISADLPSGNKVSFEQVTDYPANGAIRLKIGVREPETFTLRLRIPTWSIHTRLVLNGQPLHDPAAGNYFALNRRWSTGDELTLELDFTPRFETGREDYAGKVCIFRGPLLLASDARYASHHAPFTGPLNRRGLFVEPLATTAGAGPWFQARLTDGDGRQFTVCDFSSAGIFGDKYVSWFELKN